MALSNQEQSALDRALQERKELREAIQAASKKLEKIEQFLAMYRQFATGDSLDTEKVSEERSAVGGGVKNAQEYFQGQVRALLLEYGRPMENPEIIEKLQERGFPIASNSLQKHMYNKLWKAKRAEVLEHLPGKGYWIAGEKLSDEAAELAEAVRFERFRKQNAVERQPRGQRKLRPWEGKPGGRPRQVSDEQLAVAEEWILAGKMTRTEIAKQLGGIHNATLSYYFPGGADGINQRRQTPPDMLPRKEAIREHARLRLMLSQHNQRSRGQPSLLSDLDYEAARDRLGAIERRFPELSGS